MDSVLPTIPEFFSGKNIFITGATGYLGKALVEKILRCCPDIGNIYVLIRNKRGTDILERLKNLSDDVVFQRLKSEKPTLKIEERLIPLAGSICDLNLGLNDGDRQLITDNVHIIFHSAASVKFDDTLTDAILTNVRGTKEICELALQCKNLIAYMHVSTAYANCDLIEVQEKLYPPKADWKKLIKIAETCDKLTLAAVTQVFINHMPNTYVFTKQVAESVVNEMMAGKIPTKILRPSVVNGAIREPMEGWLGNFNGPFTVGIGYGKGFMRTYCMGNDVAVDYIPIDIVTKSLVVATWDLAARQNKSEIEVMNLANNKKANWLHIKLEQIIKYFGETKMKELPYNNMLWPPRLSYATNKYTFHFEIILYMLLPSIFLDALLNLIGRKPMVKRLVIKMYNATMALLHFCSHNWIFVNDKLFELLKEIKPEDKADWDYDFIDYDMPTYIYKCVLGSRRYLLNEPDDTIPQARIHYRRMIIIEKIVWIVIYILIAYFLLNMLFKYIAL